MGDSFREGEYFRNCKRPVLIVVPGISTCQSNAHIENLVRAAHNDNEFDVAVINYRGCGGAELATPKVATFYSYKDILEAMNYIYDTYVKDQHKQVFAVGLSKGAHHLTNILGYEGEKCFLTAAFVIQCPMKLWETVSYVHTSLFGVYDYKLGLDLT